MSGKTKEDFGVGTGEFITYLNVLNNPITKIFMTENVEIDKKQNEVEQGDILFTISSETAHEVGMSSVWLDNRPNVYLNSFCFGYRLEIKQNPLYMAYHLRSRSVRKQIELLAQGISRYNISKTKTIEAVVSLPLFHEQSQIGMFFYNIDNAITLHQRKQNHLKNVRKFNLIKYSREKENISVRKSIKRDTNAWEQRKLRDVGLIKSGVGFPENEQGGENGIPFFKISDMNKVGNEHEMKKSNNYVSITQIEERNWKPIYDIPAIIFAKVGAAIMLNRKRLVSTPFLIDNNTMAYIFDESWNSDFGKTLFETIYLPRYIQVGALPSYNGSDIGQINILMPKIEEQIKIGELFKSIDTTITLHQCTCKRRKI